MANLHRHIQVVRFGDCDPAGIVYFPRFFDWFHLAMETWFSECLGHAYAEVVQTVGFPAVHTEADFKAPCRLGEALVIGLSVGHLGRSSFRLDYRVEGPDGTLLATGATTCALVGLVPGTPEHLKAIRIPPWLRSPITTFMGGDPPRAPDATSA